MVEDSIQKDSFSSHWKYMFNDNSAGEGGGIFAMANSTLDFEGVNTFNKNRAYVSGGRIWLDNSNLSMREWEQMF